jgi:hypothetical protein
LAALTAARAHGMATVAVTALHCTALHCTAAMFSLPVTVLDPRSRVRELAHQILDH